MAKPSEAVLNARRAKDVAAVGYFGAAILGLMIILCLSHWLGELFQRRRPKNAGTLTKFARLVRSVLMRRLPYITTVGHGMIFVAYMGINVSVVLTLIDWSDPSFVTLVANRLGWVAVTNIALLTFLALKNTPLAFLSDKSYERLNILHRFAGVVTICAVLSHVFIYIGTLSQTHSLASRLLKPDKIMGMVAAGSLITTGLVALFMRRMLYETFYIIHVVLYMLLLIAVGMHQSSPQLGVIWIVTFAASIWISDRLLRAGRIIWYGGGNSVTTTPLPHSGMRIVLKRSSHRAVPGSHIFLWVPSIRTFESHPFTVVSVDPIELVVKAQDGFTRDLLKKVTTNPRVELQASMDGPYGSLPDYSLFDHIVFIAGGSGASFTFGIASSLLRNRKHPSIDFHWVIRTPEILAWFPAELKTLRASSHVNTTIHVTSDTINIPADTLQVPSVVFTTSRHATSQAAESSSLSDLAEKQVSRSTANKPYIDDYDEKQNFTTTKVDSSVTTPVNSSREDMEETSSNEKLVSVSTDLSLRSSSVNAKTMYRTINGRPNVRKLIGKEIESADRKLNRAGKPNGRVLIVACGPRAMMGDVRGAIASWVAAGEGVGVELLVEGFGW